jgi:hypothetical protein
VLPNRAVQDPIAWSSHPRKAYSSAAAWTGTSRTMTSKGGQKSAHPAQAPGCGSRDGVRSSRSNEIPTDAST